MQRFNYFKKYPIVGVVLGEFYNLEGEQSDLLKMYCNFYCILKFQNLLYKKIVDINNNINLVFLKKLNMKIVKNK